MVTPTIGTETATPVAPELAAAIPEITIASPIAPVVVPEPTPEPISPVVTPTPGVVAPTPQEEIARLQRELAGLRAAQEEEVTTATLQREAHAVYEEELAAGLSTEDAMRIAKRHYSTSRQAMARQQQDRYKLMAAEHVGNKFKVDPRLLMDGTSGPHMEEIAQRILMQKRLEVLEKGQVPAQQVNARNNSIAGNVSVTPDNIDKLWFDFEQQHPGQVNPYDEAYRKINRR